MSLRKHGLKVLSLTFFAALALMAINAAGASAGKLLILNAAKTLLSELHAQLAGKVDLLNSLHVKVLNLEIDCTAFAVEEGLYLVGGTADGKILFSGCSLYQLEPLQAIGGGCVVYPTAADRTAGTNVGHITAEAKLLVVEHKGASGTKVLVKAEPKVAGGLFSKLFFKNCAAGASAEIQGALTLLAHDNPTAHTVEHLFEEAKGSFRLDTLLYGASEATILGSVWVRLIGEHEGFQWGLC